MDIKEIFSRIRFNFAFGFSTTVGGVLATFLFEKAPEWAAVIGITVYLILMVLFLIWDQKRRMEAESAQKATEKVREDLFKTQKEMYENDKKEYYNNYDLLTASLDEVTDILKARVGMFDRINSDFESLLSEGTSDLLDAAEKFFKEPDHNEALLSRQITTQILGVICNIFERDPYGRGTTKYPHTFFKAAFFEPEGSAGNEMLRRTNWKYPPTIDPPGESSLIDPKQHPRAGAVLCWRGEEMVVIEDIPTEAEKDHAISRWEDLRPNQRKDYKSMVCVPITKGIPKTPSRHVVGVLVVDTNRERYFREELEYGAFLSAILSPFRTLIALVREFEKNQALMAKLIESLSVREPKGGA